MRHTSRSLALAVAFLSCWMLASGEARQGSRIVAIGDIHGAIEEFTSILRATGLTDAADRWAGERATLIQTGDYTDRGAGVRAVLDLLMSLEGQARSARGAVVVLLGNHELMNLLGDQRDVTPEIYLTFAASDAEPRREKAYAQYAALTAQRAKLRSPLPAVYARTREEWMAAHPPGWLEYRDAFGPRGKYGAWLRQRSIFAKQGGTLFMHAGLNPNQTPAPKAEDVNQRVRDEVRRMDRYLQRLVDLKLALPFFTLDEILQATVAEIEAVNGVLASAKSAGEQADLSAFDMPTVREGVDILKVGEWASTAPEGAMWYRGYAQAPESSLEAPLAAVLAANQVSRLVVGHTPQASWRITPRMGLRILLIDTGMLTSVYQGRPSALELADGRLTAIYVGERVALEK
jgi:hypothetical protein